MPWGTDKRMMELFDIADRKGFDVVKSTTKNHVRLIGADGKSVKSQNGGAAFSYAEARRHLEGLPDRKGDQERTSRPSPSTTVTSLEPLSFEVLVRFLNRG